MNLAADRDALFLHGFEQRRLRLGRGAIDLIGEDNVGEHRPALKLKNFTPRWMVGQHVGAGDISRHKVGRKLNAREAQTQNFAEASHHQSFAQPRHSL